MMLVNSKFLCLDFVWMTSLFYLWFLGSLSQEEEDFYGEWLKTSSSPETRKSKARYLSLLRKSRIILQKIPPVLWELWSI